MLILSSSQQEGHRLEALIQTIDSPEIHLAHSAQEGRTLAIRGKFSLVLVDAPMKEDHCLLLVKELAENTDSQILFLVNEEIFEKISAQLEEIGVLTLKKPLAEADFLQALRFLRATFVKLHRLEKQRDDLAQKIQDIRLINRAKFVLISHLNMSETEAHKYLEKEAMNTRVPRVLVAKKILKTYDT